MFFFNETDTMGFDYSDWTNGGGLPAGWDNGVGVGYNVPGYNPTTGGSSINWNQMWSNIFGVGSQAIAAWGQNPTQQVGNAGITGIGQGYSPAAVSQGYAAIAAAQNQQGLQGGVRPNTVGGANSLDGIFNSITSTVSANPMIFLGLGVGAYLLFRDPPRRR
jgi:hypothetical protein